LNEGLNIVIERGFGSNRDSNRMICRITDACQPNHGGRLYQRNVIPANAAGPNDRNS
jgi:hypothetical protein